MTRARRWAVAVVVSALVVALTGCSGDGSEASAPAQTPAAIASSLDPADPTATPTAQSPVEPAAVVVPSPVELQAGRSDPVEDPYYPELSNPEIDVLHYFLDLDWDGDRLQGVATVTFRAVRGSPSVRLDLAGALRVGEVRLDGVPIKSAQVDDGLVMAIGSVARDSVHALTIPYAGTPTTTPAPAGRADMAEGLGWSKDADGSVHTFQEPYGAYTWYPVNDHPSDEALYDASITTYDGQVGVFNGELETSDTGDGATTNGWHLEEPAASYLTTLAIGPYTEHVEESPEGMAISYWLMDADEALLPALAMEGGTALDWMVDHAGPYPFSSLGVVVVGGSSAMESQTMVTMSRGSVERSDAVLQHELAHQWFGNSVSPRDWQAMWLNEGWAMYMQQWYESDLGRPVYGGGLGQWRALDQESRLGAGPPGDFDPEWFGDLNVYLGPAMMLDRIRQRVGDEMFERIVKRWASDHEGATVDRVIFETWLSDLTGESYASLLARWLDSRRTPR